MQKFSKCVEPNDFQKPQSHQTADSSKPPFTCFTAKNQTQGLAHFRGSALLLNYIHPRLFFFRQDLFMKPLWSVLELKSPQSHLPNVSITGLHPHNRPQPLRHLFPPEFNILHLYLDFSFISVMSNFSSILLCIAGKLYLNQFHLLVIKYFYSQNEWFSLIL